MYLVPDLEEEILLRLPLKSIFKFTTVSKQWKSIMRTRRFAERRLKLQKAKKKTKPKFLVAVDHHHRSDSPRFGEIDLVYLHSYDATTRPSLTCEGLVCIPVPGFVNVYNPCTGASISFPSGPDPVDTRYGRPLSTCYWWNTFPAYWVMGFGRDIVNGSYKVVRMFYDPEPFCEILDINIGEWKRSVNPPPYNVEARRKSVFVNGSIYWLEMMERLSILALDLHTEEFHHIPTPPICCESDQLVNLDDRLTIAKTDNSSGWTLEVLCFDPQDMSWSLTYSISLRSVVPSQPWQVWCRPLAISRKGNLFFCDSKKRLFKYCPKTGVLRCIASEICVLSPFIEDLVSLPSAFSVPKTLEFPSSRSQASKFGFFKRFPSVFFTTTLVSLILFRYFVVSSRS